MKKPMKTTSPRKATPPEQHNGSIFDSPAYKAFKVPTILDSDKHTTISFVDPKEALKSSDRLSTKQPKPNSHKAQQTTATGKENAIPKPPNLSPAKGGFKVQQNVKIRALNSKVSNDAGSPSEELTKALAEALGASIRSDDDVAFQEASGSGLDDEAAFDSNQDGNNHFLFSAIYGIPNPTIHGELWQDLLKLQITSDKAWLMASDFNATTSIGKHRGGARSSTQGRKIFRDFIKQAGLLDLGFIGPKFTWQHGRLMTFPFLGTVDTPLGLSKSGQKALDQGAGLVECINSFIQEAQYWNTTVFREIGKTKRCIRSHLSSIRRSLEESPFSLHLLNLERKLLVEYEDICLSEELLWLQNSRNQWINDGDRNTKFYHTKALICRRRNRVLMLKTNENLWEANQTKLRTMVVDCFKNLYTPDQNSNMFGLGEGMFSPLPDSMLNMLDCPITKEETKQALFNMAPLKSPGADGLHALFFQSQWDITGETVFNEIRRIFEGGRTDPTLNRTLIALIPKTENAQTLKDFQPISLCTTFYKILTKIISKRLQSIMPLLTLPYQSSFIKGRSIIDNIIIAQEAIHSMRRKSGKSGWMAIKVDLEKAFDRPSWDFVQDTLVAAKIPCNIIQIIMDCITSVSMQVLWNGCPTDSFYPQRGIRQGDPLSPYLSVLCIERFSQAIQHSVSSGAWKPIKLCHNGPSLSHLFFAYDLILSTSIFPSQVRVIQQVLSMFCLSSGQKVSEAKTKVFFSTNVDRQQARAICTQLGFNQTYNLGRYLGVPIIYKRVTKEAYHYIVE
ncbi:uncharacterized protein LOC114717017 [Neltuma alba]|uniref:uncharacterized protein LOC114717017 n=1 Tax=Neltuma alba TaxID=207710 RepID=UPI0010A3CC1F|nr:uncharacterized protein LOC114717017 [Prosopis alba]